MALAACHEDDSGGSPVAPTGMTVSVLGDTLLSRNAAYESITLSVSGLSDADSVLCHPGVWACPETSEVEVPT